MYQYVYDDSFSLIEDPDLEKGKLEQKEIKLTHKYVVETEEVGHWNVIAEYPETGGKDVEWAVDVPEVGHWETRRDGDILFDDYPEEIPEDWSHDEEYTTTFYYCLYVPYTKEELEQIAKDNAEAERLNQIADYKQKLADTDYILTKMVEYNVSNTPMPEDDAARYAEIIEQRAQWRAEINRLESEEAQNA